MKNLRLLIPVFIVFALLCSLGTWQINRLAWKQDLIAQLASQQKMPPQNLRSLMQFSNTEIEYLPITDKGALDVTKPLFLQATLNGTAAWRVIAPFTSQDGITVLVDLGTSASREIALKPQSELIGLVRRHAAPKSPYDLENDVDANIWFWWDVPAMQKASNLKGEIAPFVVQATSNTSGLKPQVAKIELRNQHLGYAITWFGLAAALVAVTMAFVLKRK